MNILKNEADVINIESKNKKINVLIERDNWNSEHFELLMGNLSIKLIDSEYDDDLLGNLINLAINEAKKRNFKHLTCKIDTNFKNAVYYLEKENFNIMDTLVTYIFSYEKNKLNEVNHQCSIRDCETRDLSDLKRIAKKSFEIDRFHADKRLENRKCDEYYEQWVENSFNGLADKVLVADCNNEPVGFTTCKLPNNKDENKVGHLVLSAVSSESRGKGVYTSMIYNGIKWLDGKAKFVKVGTQINNIAVQKSWIKLGFTVNESQYVFHKTL